MIRNHMSAFRDNQYLNDVSHRFSKCPQSLILHFADMLSTYTNESNDLQKRLNEAEKKIQTITNSVTYKTVLALSGVKIPFRRQLKSLLFKIYGFVRK